MCLLFNLQKQKTPPFCYCFITICYERLVDHCSLGDDLGSLPRYCIFNVYLIRVRPRSNLASLPGSSVQRFIIASDSCFMFSCFMLSCVVLVLRQCCLVSCYFVQCGVLLQFFCSALPLFQFLCFAVNSALRRIQRPLLLTWETEQQCKSISD